MSKLTWNAFAFPEADYYFEQPWTLDSKTYLLTLRFNDRVQLWFLDIADATGTALLSGVALRASRNLLGAYPGKGLPSGVLAVFDATGQDSDPTANSFATTHSLLYGSQL